MTTPLSSLTIMVSLSLFVVYCTRFFCRLQISGPNNDNSCEEDLSCPAPMYLKNGEYLGTYSNNPLIAAPTTQNEGDFGLGNYEPEFFFPFPSWLEVDEYQVTLKYDNDDFTGKIHDSCLCRTSRYQAR
jgi:hypothetical protein